MTANVRMNADPRWALRLKADRFDELWPVIVGPMTIREIAERLGTDHRNFSQMRTGKRPVSLQVVAAVKVEMPNVPFDDLYEVCKPADFKAKAGES